MRNRQKKIFILGRWHNKCIFYFLGASLIMLLMLSVLTGCGTQSASTQPSPLPKSVKADTIRFVSGRINGSWVRIAAAIASKANAYFEDYPVTVSTGGVISNLYLIQKGEAEIGFSQGIFLSKAIAGEPPFESPLDHIAGIAALDTTALYIIADEKIPENTLGELIKNDPGIRLGTLPKIDASGLIMDLVFKGYGLSGSAAIQEPGSDVYVAEGSTLFKAYVDHYFDILVVDESIPDPAIRELMKTNESKIISLDPEILSALSQQNDVEQVTIPAGTYPGQTEDVQTVGLKTILIAHDDMPEESVYYLTKAICENKAYFETIHDSYKSININGLPKHLVVPLHPGAERYYRETGLLQEKGGL
jgi:hypothetical protein